jgi:fructose-1,6-bisphosphatase II
MSYIGRTEVNIEMQADESFLALELLPVVEQAAIESAKLMGSGDRHAADQAATEAMRKAMDHCEIDGTIVIGEGERDEAPMLYIGEKVGQAGSEHKIDIAVDPLEGTNLCATGANNAIAVMAVSEPGGLLHAPDIYMQKLVVPPSAAGKVDLDAPIGDTAKVIGNSLGRDVNELVAIVLDRPRHEKLIGELRKAGVRIKLIGDGDLSAGITAAVRGTGVHFVAGIGGAPEGVLTAAAMKCLGGEILGRLVTSNKEQRERAEQMGIDFERAMTTDDLAPGKNIVFIATGVTRGDLLNGVRYFGNGCRVSSLVMTYASSVIRFIDSIHITEREQGVPIRRM